VGKGIQFGLDPEYLLARAFKSILIEFFFKLKRFFVKGGGFFFTVLKKIRKFNGFSEVNFSTFFWMTWCQTSVLGGVR